MARRILAVLGGVVLGAGVDQVEGVDSEPGFLVAGVGVGLLVAALVRE